MLGELDVRNLGIIEHIHLSLDVGFGVLTGETGAGKSLLVQSLQLLAGVRAEADQVRSGCDRLQVEGRFAPPQAAAARALLAELGVDADGELVVRREVAASGRSRAWVNDVAVTAGSLQRLAPHLLSIDGQHEQRGLTDPGTHLAVIDEAGGLEDLRSEVGQAFAAWDQVTSRLGLQRQSLASRRDRLDVISFQAREIEEARLQGGEDQLLREERNLLRHAGRIAELAGGALQTLGGEAGATSLARAARAVRELEQLGLGLGQTGDDLAQAQILAEEAERALQGLVGRVRIDPARLEAVEARLATIERLARKYGGSLDATLAHFDALYDERARLEAVEDDIARLEGQERDLVAGYLELALRLSAARRNAATAFCREVVRVLARVGMPRVELRLEVRRQDDPGGALDIGGTRVNATPSGIDGGEFVISPNPGEEARPMARIASGGELSRLHLAMRTVLRERQSAGDRLTLLFDEVDSGIGGQVADELGALLAEQGRSHQVLAVTHLPQVAVRAASHFVVGKVSEGERTVARVRAVEGEERVGEVVRMLGGVASETARAHARALLGLS